MGLLETLTGRRNGDGNGSEAAPADREAAAYRALEDAGWTPERLQHLGETIAELELKLLDLSEPGWLPLGTSEDFDFSRDFLDDLVRKSRLYAIKNPLIKQQVRVYTNYVWGQGISVTGKGAVNDVMQAFLSANRRAVFGYKAAARLNRSLMTDGTVALRLFPNISTGAVKVRPLRFDELRARITNPDDASEDWFWLRSYVKDGKPVRVLYPDLSYRPGKAQRAKTYNVPNVGAVAVEWDTPVYVLKVNDLDGMAFGVPETYAGMDWAKAYKEYLENWAKFVRSLTRWAWKMKTTGNQTAVNAVQAALDTQFGDTTSALIDANPAPTTGAAFVGGAGVDDMEPIKLGGATFPSADGRRLLLMVASAAGLPETFFGDAEVGTLATAKSLDRPTELNFSAYQTMWGETYGDLLAYVVDCAAKAPSGPLRALFASEDPETGAVTLKDTDAAGEPVTRAVDIDWPPIVHDDTESRVKAIALAVKTNAIDDAPLVARMLLTALGEQDIDDALRRLYPPEDEEPEAIPLPKTAPRTIAVAAPAAPPTEETAGDAATEARLAAALEALRPLLGGDGA